MVKVHKRYSKKLDPPEFFCSIAISLRQRIHVHVSHLRVRLEKNKILAFFSSVFQQLYMQCAEEQEMGKLQPPAALATCLGKPYTGCRLWEPSLYPNLDVRRNEWKPTNFFSCFSYLFKVFFIELLRHPIKWIIRMKLQPIENPLVFVSGCSKKLRNQWNQSSFRKRIELSLVMNKTVIDISASFSPNFSKKDWNTLSSTVYACVFVSYLDFFLRQMARILL